MSCQEGWKNKLCYGDNLDVMRKSIADESIDVIYLDPPFKSDANYNLLFRADGLSPDEAQLTAFKDTWVWDEVAAKAFAELQDVPNPMLVGVLNAFQGAMPQSPMFAYLVNMALRLIEMRKKLKTTGSLYLHCDPTASHYLKLILDAIFGVRNFKNEIVWCYTGPSQTITRFLRKHDIILFYSKTQNNVFNWREVAIPYSDETIARTGRGAGTHGLYGDMEKEEEEKHKNRLKKEGKVPEDWWTDIFRLQGNAKERLGYPTQKPEALLERIIKASSNEGDLILDPFCGCGTAVAVAQRLKRRWIGIDVSPFAIELIRNKRLGTAFPELKVGVDYVIEGLPTTLDGAKLLAEQDKKAFEIWAVARVDGIPNEKKGADKGIDGRIPFKPDGKTSKFAVVSVKGGKLKADDIRALIAVAKREQSSSLGFGFLVTLEEPTKGMRADAASAGVATINNEVFQFVQILTIEEVLKGKGPKLPLLDKGTFKAAPMAKRGIQDSML
jgi:DNA modification methylase